MFRIVQNLGGSVTLNSAHYVNEVIYMNELSDGVEVGIKNFNRNFNERFYLRTNCSDKNAFEVEDNGTYTLYENNKKNTVAGINKK